MTSDHITDAQIDAFFNEWFCDDNWRQGASEDFINNKILALRDALFAYERATWQPIETAPRDVGAEVLLFVPPFPPMQGTRRSDGTWMVGARGLIGRAAPDEPTDWRPLPPAPEAADD